MDKIIFLDGYTLNPGDLSWGPLDNLGDFSVFPETAPDQVVERARNADILIINKVQITETVLEKLPGLKAVMVAATGHDNVDGQAAAQRGIPVSNVVGYSTDSVAQHTFALLFALTNRCEQHSRSVKEGSWSRQLHFSMQLAPLQELYGKRFGIYGYGTIGKKVARIARSFGMEVNVHHYRNISDPDIPIKQLEKTAFFQNSDVISLHAPLTESNTGFVDRQHLEMLPQGAYLLNTARGGLIQNEAVRDALESGKLAGAGLDVLDREPPPADHPLLQSPNCVITPHNAWASVQARQRLIEGLARNISAFLKGSPQNVVNE